MSEKSFSTWNGRATNGLRDQALSDYVLAVTKTLGNDLDRAQTLTSDWSQTALTDALVDVAVRRFLAALETTGLAGAANRLPSSRIWNLMGDRLALSWLVNRARTKPRGYAGDYELLDRICENRVGEHPLGGALDRFFQRQAAPNAVRARTELIAAAAVEAMLDGAGHRLHWVSVGAGPATDVRWAAAMLPEASRQRLRVTLLDLDPEALDFAREQIARLVPEHNLTTRQVNPKRLHQIDDALPEADFLACPGLFDYLDDATAALLLSLFWQRVRPGGRLFVGNFAPYHPTRSYMEWIGNWYLIYRTAEQLSRLAAQASIPSDAFSITAERFGVDLFIVAKKR